MNYLYDSQQGAPKLTPIELFGDEAKHAFLSLRAFWLADSLQLAPLSLGRGEKQ